MQAMLGGGADLGDDYKIIMQMLLLVVVGPITIEKRRKTKAREFVTGFLFLSELHSTFIDSYFPFSFLTRGLSSFIMLRLRSKSFLERSTL